VSLVLRPAAIADIRAAREHYERVDSRLSERLAEDIDRLFARLEAFPRSAPAVAGYEGVRRARLRRFPLAVFYRLGGSRIDVLRVMHTARAPEGRPR
jgi:plasmid stabilization system protein ParE